MNVPRTDQKSNDDQHDRRGRRKERVSVEQGLRDQTLELRPGCVGCAGQRGRIAPDVLICASVIAGGDPITKHATTMNT